MTKHPNIRRVDNDVNKTHGWIFQIQRKDQQIIKMFSDGVYGGKQEALDAAIEYKDIVAPALTTYDYYWSQRNIVRRNNQSGIPGVGRYEVNANPENGKGSAFWTAFWDDEHGVRRQRKFAVKTYGEAKAKALAVAERKARLKEVCKAKLLLNLG